MKKSPFIRSPYNYDLEEASDQATIPAEAQGVSLTVQSMAEDADINVLMKRYGITGQMPSNPRIPEYGDFSHITDFRSALEAVSSAQDKFMEYPAELRAKFENNPQLFLEFCSQESNRAQMEALGLLKKKPGGVVATPPPGNGSWRVSGA